MIKGASKRIISNQVEKIRLIITEEVRYIDLCINNMWTVSDRKQRSELEIGISINHLQQFVMVPSSLYQVLGGLVSQVVYFSHQSVQMSSCRISLHFELLQADNAVTEFCIRICLQLVYLSIGSHYISPQLVDMTVGSHYISPQIVDMTAGSRYIIPRLVNLSISIEPEMVDGECGFISECD